MAQHYRKNLELYLHSYKVMVSNRSKMETVRENTQLRLIIRSRSTMERYMKSLHWSKRFEKILNSVVTIQKNWRMVEGRRKFRDRIRKVVRIQRAWKRYCAQRQDSLVFSRNYFGVAEAKQEDWHRDLFRSTRKISEFETNEGMERIFEKYEKLKKEKMSLFYYLLDVQIIQDDFSLKDWHKNYLTLAEDNLLKQTPLQYVDVANTHTAVATISKVYTWGEIETNPAIKEIQINQGRLHKIFADNYLTRVETTNPSAKI